MKKSMYIMITFVIFCIVLTSSTYAAYKLSPYTGSSSWAVPELDRAVNYGFITESISREMAKPISREELAELSVRLYEQYTGKKAVAADKDTFRDTRNPEVLKAYRLGIVEGTDSFWRLFSPGATATREQVAAMLYRTIKAMYPGADMNTVESALFSDKADISGWALEAVSFMRNKGFIKGIDERIYPKVTCSREMAVIIVLRIYEEYSPENGIGEAEDPGTGSFMVPESLVINDTVIGNDSFSIVEKSGKPYILVASDKFKYAFKQADAGYYTYPEVSIIGGSISIYWNSENGILMQVEMQENSSKALLNGTMTEMGAAPYSKYGKMFIPIDFLIAERQMTIEESREEGIMYIQYAKSFSEDLLLGTWSDSNLNLFDNLDRMTGGSLDATAFSTGYRFNSDGTYSHSMASILEDSNDTLIMEEGRYRISGNTILCYDIAETVYKGYPLKQQYSGRKSGTPQYLFIYNYDKGRGRIEIGGFWLKKLS